MKTAARLRRLCLASGSAVLLLGVTAASADDKEKSNQGKPLAEKMTKMDEKIYFGSDEAMLTAEARATLDEVAAWAKENRDRKVVLAGHSDEVGPDEYNFELAKERAVSARDYLEMQNVGAEQIEVVSFGEELAAGDGQALEDRKVVFLIDRDAADAQASGAWESDDLDSAQDDRELDGAPGLDPRAELDTDYTGPSGSDDTADPADSPDTAVPEPYNYRAESTPAADDDDRPGHLITRDGMSMSVGGGVMNFVDDDTRGFTNLGGSWDARLTYGTRSIVAGEIAYIGSAQEIDALGLDSSAALLGSGGEAAARINIGKIPYVQPYALAGVGVTNYSIVNSDFNTSNVDDSETVFHVPLGVGVGFRGSGFLFDVRGTYRPAFQDGLIDNQEDQIGEVNDDGIAELDSWGATASAGVEF